LLLLEGLLEGVQLGVQGLAQQVHRLVQQRANRVWVGQQAALGSMASASAFSAA
jgi:hypothetical protein